MKKRILESESRMKFLLGNNPIGELVKVVTKECGNTKKNKKILEKT